MPLAAMYSRLNYVTPLAPAHPIPLQERKLAMLVYGFPPGVGATGTAALLNVPKSLEHVLATLQQVGHIGLGRVQ